MKILCLLLVTELLIATPGLAEPPAPIPPPVLPLLHRAPAFAAWTIALSKVEQKPNTPAPRSRFDLSQSLSVTKTDQTYYEQTTLQSGKKIDRWIYNNLELKTRPENGQIVYVPSAEDPSLGTFRFRDADFDGLSWLSMDNYHGIKAYEGNPAYFFETKVSPDTMARKRTAYLSLEAQLPLYSSDGWVVSVYKYQSPPSAALTPPEDFMKIFRQLEIDRRESQRGPGQ